MKWNNELSYEDLLEDQMSNMSTDEFNRLYMLTIPAEDDDFADSADFFCDESDITEEEIDELLNIVL